VARAGPGGSAGVAGKRTEQPLILRKYLRFIQAHNIDMHNASC
jgi:hypothetical protein